MSAFNKRHRAKLNARSKAWYDAHPGVKRSVYQASARNMYIKNGGYKRSGTLAKKLEFLAALKAGPCHDCHDHFDPVCMDWDHRDPSTKKHAIAEFRTLPCTKREILQEIAKCDLVCSNCHRLRTKRRGRVSKHKEMK